MNILRDIDVKILFFINKRLHNKYLHQFFRLYTEFGGVIFYSLLIIFLFSQTRGSQRSPSRMAIS